MEITPQGISAATAVFGLILTIGAMLIRSSFGARDGQIRGLVNARETDRKTASTQRTADMDGIKSTQKILFGKLDEANKSLSEYKLHVAETYVNQAALEKLLSPIERRLGSIEEDIRSAK